MDIDVDALIAEAQAEVSEETQPSDGDQKLEDAGPVQDSESESDETGELDEDSDETGWDEESEEEDEGEEEFEEEGDDLPVEDEPEPEAESEDTEPQVSPEVAQLQSQLRQTQEALVKAQQDFAAFQHYVLGQQQAGGPGAVPGAQSQPELREALSILVQPGQDRKSAEERFKQLPPATQRQAIELLKQENEDLVMGIMDPMVRFRKIAPYVQQMIHEAVGPIFQERQAKQVNTLASEYAQKLKSPADRQRFVEILDRVPGGDAELEQRLELAYVVFEKEKSAQSIARESQKLKTQKRQMKANKRSARGTGRGKKRKGRRKANVENIPTDDVEAMFNAIKEAGDY